MYWLEVEEYQREGRPAFVDWALKKAPLRVGPHLHRKIYSRNMPVIFTSATLTTAERRFEFFADRLGLQNVDAPDRFYKIGTSSTTTNGPFWSWLTTWKRPPVARTWLASNGCLPRSWLTFCGSPGAARSVSLPPENAWSMPSRGSQEDGIEGLEEAMGHWSIPVFCQERSRSRKALKEEFSGRDEAVLLGLKSFWEGIPMPGKSLSFVVMEKLPFPMMGDPLIQARAETI